MLATLHQGICDADSDSPVVAADAVAEGMNAVVVLSLAEIAQLQDQLVQFEKSPHLQLYTMC